MLEGGFCRATCDQCAAEPRIPVPEAAPPTATGPAAPTTDAFCSQPPERGPCRAALPSWYYDAAARDCKLFLFGGCQVGGLPVSVGV